MDPKCGFWKGGIVARLSPTRAQAQVQLEDGYLIALAKQGSADAYDRLVRRYYSFVRLKASSYFLIGGDSEDLIQEGLVGLYKAIRDFRPDRESSFRNFAELCITRQIITAVKTATRNKHTPLNGYVSFSSTPAGATDNEPTLDEMLPGSTVHDPVNQVISSEELRSLVACLSTVLSELESQVLGLYLDGGNLGLDEHGRPWGLGVLDREWDPSHEVWTVDQSNSPGKATGGTLYVYLLHRFIVRAGTGPDGPYDSWDWLHTPLGVVAIVLGMIGTVIVGDALDQLEQDLEEILDEQ
jgi:RNA polymerase sporulation-specific sigma factor